MAKEQRLIDANALIEKLRAHRDLFVSAWSEFKEMPPKDKARVDELGMCIAETLNAPTVDAVEVVRCRDCKQWSRNSGIAESPNGHCFCHDIETNGHDFCSYGERRTNERKAD